MAGVPISYDRVARNTYIVNRYILPTRYSCGNGGPFWDSSQKDPRGHSKSFRNLHSSPIKK
jgi:hypothetical protein